jgi:hypothetical protein
MKPNVVFRNIPARRALALIVAAALLLSVALYASGCGDSVADSTKDKAAEAEAAEERLSEPEPLGEDMPTTDAATKPAAYEPAETPSVTDTSTEQAVSAPAPAAGETPATGTAVGQAVSEPAVSQPDESAADGDTGKEKKQTYKPKKKAKKKADDVCVDDIVLN